MKINTLYIASFGGIKNLKLSFTDGFNVVYGDNENGKTTVMAFIKMMFYGSDRGSAQISKNIRKKYTPWDATQMAGSIDFTYMGKDYRLEREFRSSNSTDKATLCDLAFGTRQAVGSDIGAKFFGLSAAAFERSVFIGQFGFPENDSAAEGELNSKLSNLVLTGDETTSYETVNARLEKAKLSLMSKSGRAGEYDKTVKRIAEIEEKLEKAERIKEEYNKKQKDIALAEEKITLMHKNAEVLKQKISAEQDIKNAQKLREFLELKEQLNSINKGLKLSDGSLADDMYLGKLRFAITKAQGVTAKKQAKLSEIATLEKTLDAGLNPPEDATMENAERLKAEIKELECKAKSTEQKISALQDGNGGKSFKKSNLWIVFLILAIACSFLTGVLAFAVNSALAPTVTATMDAVLICVMTAILVANRTKRREYNASQKQAEQEIAALKEIRSDTEKLIFEKTVKLQAINTALLSSEAVLERQKEMLKIANAELTALQAEEREALVPLFELFSRYSPEKDLDAVLNAVNEIGEKAKAQKEIKNQLNFISRDIGAISYEEARTKLNSIGETVPTINTEDFEAVKGQYEKLISDITEHKSAVAGARASAKAMLLSAEDGEILKKELAVLSERAKSQKEFCFIADIAMETLRESFAEVRRSYGSVLEKRANSIFTQLTDNRYNDMSISKAFDINVSKTDDFGSREVDYLSSGTADQAYLSLRLAVTKLICDGKESLPVLLDDSLAQYDDNRCEKAIKCLNDFSRDFQTVMFTCHKSVSETASDVGANLIRL